jgi:protein-tyrosine phosphatase
MHAAMIDLYRELPAWMAPRLRAMFGKIASDQVSLLVHCAAGKDRTGIAIALLMHVLDIPEETIVADYLLTNQSEDFEEFIRTRQLARLGVDATGHPLFALPDEVRRVLFAADAAYLHGAFDEMRRSFGGIDEYLRDAVGLDEAVRTRVRRALLTA